MVRYYREKETGDYLQAWWDYTLRNPGGMPTVRAAAIAGNRRSVCTTTASPEFLRLDCEPVRKANVPPEWLAQF